MPGLAFKRASDAGAEPCARLIYESFAEFYDLVPLGKADLLAAIAGQIGLAGSELADTEAALVDDRVAGVCSALRAAGLGTAQMLSTLRLAAGLPADARARFLAKVEVYRKGVPPVPKESYYLARIAVDTQYRGQGVGRRLLSRFADRAGDKAILSVHVRADNDAAIHFYKTNGFINFDSRPSGYLTLVKRCSR